LLQISSLSKSCYSHIRELRCIRPYIDSKIASVPDAPAVGILRYQYPTALLPLLSTLNLTTVTLFLSLK